MLGLGLSIPQVATRATGVGYRIILDGLIWERVTDDATGQFVFDDATGLPVYAQVLA